MLSAVMKGNAATFNSFNDAGRSTPILSDRRRVLGGIAASCAGLAGRATHFDTDGKNLANTDEDAFVLHRGAAATVHGACVLSTAILFKITHCKKSTVSPIYHDLPPLFWWEGLDGSAWVDDLFDDLRKRVRQCGPGQFLGGLKLDLGNFNTEFFEGRNR